MLERSAPPPPARRSGRPRAWAKRGRQIGEAGPRRQGRGRPSGAGPADGMQPCSCRMAAGARPVPVSTVMRVRSSTSSLFLQHALQELDLVEERVVLVDLLLDLAD